ncbi:MAG: phosphatase PAP2 family protein [Candidatus Promineifilaceae bacterium]
MENLYNTSLEFTRWLQENFPQLAGFFKLLTDTGAEEFYVALLPLIYWCINKRLGKILVYVLFVSVTINTMLKHALRQPRPFWIDPAVAIDATGGYGIPSGHTQYATTIYLLVAAAIGSVWAWIVALFLILVMGFSRVYVGAHFIHDVVAGFLVGLIILVIALVGQKQFGKAFSRRILGQRMMLAMLVVITIAAVYILILYLIGAPDLSVPWAGFIPQAEIDSITEMASAIGALLGVSVGILLEGSRVRFRADGPLSKRIARYLLGIAITVIVWRGLGYIFPREPLAIAIPLRIFRYFLVTLWASYYAPWLFVRLGLADSDPAPGLNLRL